jgi:hypothetical protein
MATFRRAHTELLLQISKDRAREQVVGEVDFEQDDDVMTLIKGPVDVNLAANAAATEVTLPTGAVSLMLIVVTEVTTATGINLHIGGAGNDAVLVAPPTGSGQEGYCILATDTTSLHLSNPSATTAVSATVILGCTES